METESQKKSLAMLMLPFNQNEISKLPKPYKKDSPPGNCKECGGYHGLPALHLDYVGHAALTKRLLETDPLWSWEPVAWDSKGFPARDEAGGMWIRLTVCGMTRLGYGDAQGKTGPNATKEVIGDALRNAAMRFGAALELWHKGGALYDQSEIDEIMIMAGEVPHDAEPATKKAKDVEMVMLNKAQIAEIEDLLIQCDGEAGAVTAGRKIIDHLTQNPEATWADIPASRFGSIVASIKKKIDAKGGK